MKEIDWDNLPPSTMPSSLSVCVKGFYDPDVAEKLGRSVREVIELVGSFIDLARLDGVTIACDYDQALAELDRGIEGLRPLSRSNSEEMQGVAMSPAVMRGNVVRTHLVFDAAFVVALIADEATDDERAIAVGIIAHECAHVQITEDKERSIPAARFGSPVPEGFERAVMFQIAEIAWDEYSACRLSALFSPRQNATHAETLAGVVKEARECADQSIRDYRIHGDLDRLVGEAGSALCGPLKVSAYLLGGMDAIGCEWVDFPDVEAALSEGGYLELVNELWSELRRLWDTRNQWEPTLSVFSGLEDIAHKAFRSGGLIFSTSADGQAHIDVPFTAKTMP